MFASPSGVDWSRGFNFGRGAGGGGGGTTGGGSGGGSTMSPQRAIDRAGEMVQAPVLPPLNAGLNAALDRQIGIAQQGRGDAAASAALDGMSGIVNRAGVPLGTGTATRTLDDIASGARRVNTGGDFRAIGRTAAGPSSAAANLSGMASADPRNSPYLDELEGIVNDRIAEQARLAASAAGRGYGSGFESDRVARGIAENILAGRLSQYNRDADRKIAANQAIDNAFNQRAGIRLAATQGETGVQGTNLANQGNAAQAALDARLQAQQDQIRAAAIAPELARARYMDVQQQREAEAVRQAREDLENETQWQRLAQYMQNYGISPYQQAVLDQNQALATQQAGLEQQRIDASRPSTFQQLIGTAGLIGGALTGGFSGGNSGGGIVGRIFDGLF